MEKLLEIKDLSVQYVTDENTFKAVNGIGLSIGEGEIIGLVGETGAGKTTTALSVLQLLPKPAGVITGGEILFGGVNILFNTEEENRKMRGAGVSMVFQDPMTSLNPTMTIGRQLTETLLEHTAMTRKEARDFAVKTLERVGIMENRFGDYPHQLSGGQKQRVVIAIALLCSPKLLIADEPTTGLDVTIQAQVLSLIQDIIKERNMSMLLITHDLGIVAENCSKVNIMYGGEILESGSVTDVFQAPRHPYTVGLFRSIPRLDEETDELEMIPGEVANPADLPKGCVFHPRCPYAKDICSEQKPEATAEGSHSCKCHFPLNLGGAHHE